MTQNKLIKLIKLNCILVLAIILFIIVFGFSYNNSNVFEKYTNYQSEYDIKPLKNVNVIEYTNTFKKNLLDKDMDFHYSNSSIIENPKNKNNYIMNVRCINYKILDDNKYVLDGGKHITLNKLFELNHNFEIINNNLCDNNNNINDEIVGIEDVRLYNNNEDIFYSGSYFDNSGFMKISHNKYQIENNKLDLKPNIINVDFKTQFTTEKNWVYFKYNNEICVIYQWYPLKICKIIDNKKLVLVETKEVPKEFKDFRGSSCGVEYDNKIWFMVHYKDNINFVYHYFVCFDKNMNLIKYSKPFIFENLGIEYSMSFIIKNNKIIIPYTIKDTILKLGIYDKDYILNNIDYIYV